MLTYYYEITVAEERYPLKNAFWEGSKRSYAAPRDMQIHMLRSAARLLEDHHANYAEIIIYSYDLDTDERLPIWRREIDVPNP